jgi:hypothetical protein
MVKIVILQRGFVMVGEFSKEGSDCKLEKAAMIRRWGTTKGLGEIAESGPTPKTVLDPCGVVNFHELTVIASIDCKESAWASKLQ